MSTDPVVRNDEMRGETTEAKDQVHPACMRMTMDVGQGLLRQPVDRRFGGFRHFTRNASNIEGCFNPSAAPEAFDQQFHRV